MSWLRGAKQNYSSAFNFTFFSQIFKSFLTSFLSLSSFLFISPNLFIYSHYFTNKFIKIVIGEKKKRKREINEKSEKIEEGEGNIERKSKTKMIGDMNILSDLKELIIFFLLK